MADNIYKLAVVNSTEVGQEVVAIVKLPSVPRTGDTVVINYRGEEVVVKRVIHDFRSVTFDATLVV